MRLNLRNLISSYTRDCISSSLRCNISSLSLIPDLPNATESISKPDLETLVLKQYKGGKFHNLIQTVVATPSVISAACENLVADKNPEKDASFDHFPIESITRDLRSNEFHVGSHCVRMLSSRQKGEPLILPDLKLKVVIEAVRMVLEVVYERRFVTFSYGGRVGMGRHTAIRYLKNSVENPNWWFRVEFNSRRFDLCHVHKLLSIVEEKVEDRDFINLVLKFFESEAVQIELGGCILGRGFPQESSLNAILVNIYFNGLDQEIQDLRRQIDGKNPIFNSDELSTSTSSRVFHKPVKVYAVRYLDEILVVTSGSKMLTMNLKDKVVGFLEGNLGLKVDRLNTAIHSAVSEKIDFLGMELQAVSPTVLHPPMSDKAIRALKKHIKRKEAKALEVRNARETIRKKLGLKILNHVFKKSKRCDGSKFEVKIEAEVREIFKTWADEVVQEFFASSDECWNWHRALSGGDFLSIRAVRNQLPRELVDAYDQFQGQVNKFMKPEKATKILEEEDKMEEEDRQEYAQRTVEDLTKLCMKVDAPVESIRKAVKLAGFTNSMGRPRPIKLLIALEDSDIIKWYAGVGKRWLDFFCCCHNFKTIKTIVSYHLRFSCILTLAEKHESTKREAIKHYTKDLKFIDVNGAKGVYFPTEREIKMMGDRHLSDPKPVDGALFMQLIRLASDEPLCCCVAHFCGRTDTSFYRIRLLQNRLNIDPSDHRKWVPGMGAIHESLNRKCLSVCPKHISDLYMGSISLQDIDCTMCVDVQ
ncbi:nuclear intron maturase 3, mitochondrial [Cinnamomum micranthum f. kanehirae]|uniref:Nuclear intron maturase 3, mitochondrial n=1 Tax=Cinnamomum micranthum f. kanehirae TaxID=337451 RepID=A0A3S3P1Y5_9MAGN|nr:nuclear intron maturase 3, mitochondrial [Cinnamomum micranthum f. kanehirae]